MITPSAASEQTSHLSIDARSVRLTWINMGKGGSPGERAHWARMHVITVICFDSSECLNIKLYWIWNGNSWGTRLDQHFSPSALHHTYSHTAAFICHTPAHAFTLDNPHALWQHVCKCTIAYWAPEKKKQQSAIITQQTGHKKIRARAV